MERNIAPTEDHPKLHLVWSDDRIFVKPLPRYLTSYAFWHNYLGRGVDETARTRNRRIRRAALGYLRTYYYLVKTELDFHITQNLSLRLLPKDTTWE